MLEETSAVALWSDGSRCGGVVTDAGAIAARATVLATGGGAALWRARRTRGARSAPAPFWPMPPARTSPTWSSASSTPPHWRCPGTEHDGTLLTEALRGEGAKLLDAAGERFTDELAPRDQVTEAILDRIEADRADHVRLDLRPLEAGALSQRVRRLPCRGPGAGAEPVPVAPAAQT